MQDSKVQADQLRNLFLKKQALMAELKSYNVGHLSISGIPVNFLTLKIDSYQVKFSHYQIDEKHSNIHQR